MSDPTEKLERIAQELQQLRDEAAPRAKGDRARYVAAWGAIARELDHCLRQHGVDDAGRAVDDRDGEGGELVVARALEGPLCGSQSSRHEDSCEGKEDAALPWATYDEQADAVYVYLGPHKTGGVSATVPIRHPHGIPWGVHLDLNGEGKIAGLEVMAASRWATRELLGFQR